MTRYEKQNQNVENKWTPEQKADLAARGREKTRLRREALRSDPVAWEAHLAACRVRDAERYRLKMERLKSNPDAYRQERDKQNAREQKRLAVKPRQPQERTPERVEQWKANQARYRENHRAELNARIQERRRLQKLSMTSEEHKTEQIRIAAYHKEYRAKNAELVKARKAAYNATPEGREKRRLASMRHNRKIGHRPRQKLPEDVASERARASYRKYGKTHGHIRRARFAERYKTDINFKLTKALRARVRNFLRGNDKSMSTMALLGCSIEEFRIHLEKQFQPGMTWACYGLRGWSIDHIVACTLFDLTDPLQQAKCFGYQNLAPMWHVENIRKGNTLPPGVPHPNPPCVPSPVAVTVRT